MNFIGSPCRQVDLMIGGLTENATTKAYFSTSKPYYYDDLTWCVGRAKPIPIWQNIFQICKQKVLWPMAVVTFFSVVYIFYYLMKEEDKSMDAFSIMLLCLLTMLCSSPNCNAITLPVKILYFSCLLACILLITTFNAFLINVLTHPIHKTQIQTIAELIDNDFELVGDEYALSKIRERNMVIYSN